LLRYLIRFQSSVTSWCPWIRDVEAVEYFLLPLPAPNKVSCFRVYFRYQLLSSKCFRFHTNLTAVPLPHSFPMFYGKCFRFRLLKKSITSEFFSASSFFLQSTSNLVPQKFNRFRFHIFALDKVFTGLL